MLDLAIELLLDGAQLLGAEGAEIDWGVLVFGLIESVRWLKRDASWMPWWGSFWPKQASVGVFKNFKRGNVGRN
jgi:hypothetical protein